MNKKTISISLIAAYLIIGLAQMANAEFSDVNSDHANFDAISYGQTKGIISGYSDNTFKPGNKINRAEFIKIVIAANNSATDIDGCLAKNAAPLFSDTSNSEWYAKYLCLAKMNGVIGGYPDGSFKPSQNINFAEAAKIISIAKNGHDAGSSLSDQQVDWYFRYVSFLANSKAIPGTILGIAHQITRGEMMEIIYRLDNNISNKYSLSYDQVAGKDMACIKAGQIAGGIVYPNAPSTECCSGLVNYNRTRDKGQIILGAYAGLCLEPSIGLDAAVKIMDTANECTTNADLGQTLDSAPYKNGNFNGYSFPMKSYKDLCFARCDLDLDKGSASIGWMCTGAIQ